MTKCEIAGIGTVYDVKCSDLCNEAIKILGTCF